MFAIYQRLIRQQLRNEFMLSIILGFLPWIVFSALFGESITDSSIAVIAACGVLIFTDKNYLKKGFVLVWGGFLFFPIMFLLTVVFRFDWAINNASVLSNSALALITWVSLAIGKPFTIQYARELTPEFAWQTPEFIAINNQLTMIWGIIFTFSVMLHFITFETEKITTIVHQLLSYGSIFLGAWLNSVYPEWYMKKKQKRDNKNNPFLQGNYAPIREENDFQDMPIIGKIPDNLPKGIYMRNGPNPAFEPISYTYPFDGDGMIHAMYLDNNIPRYKNRYVKTKGLLLEQKFGHAIYGGIQNPIPADDKYFQSSDEKEQFKNGAFVHIIRHANHYLAILEAVPAYEIDSSLNTLGEWCPGTTKPLKIGPHTRFDPDTQHLFLIKYDFQPPYLQIHEVDEKGLFVKSINIDKSYCTMIHDFVLTKNYFIFFDCPLVIDIAAAQKGGGFLQWQSDKGSRIALVSRHDTNVVHWITIPAFFVFHFANAYEENNTILIDYVRYNQFSLDDDNDHPRLHRMRIDLDTLQTTTTQLCNYPTEFPTFNLQHNSKSYRYLYAPISHHASHFDALMKYDLQTQQVIVHDFGDDAEIGEAVFAPAISPSSEDDGYVMLFVYHKTRDTSNFVILNAQDFSGDPSCIIQLPRRVPHGLHGSWFPQN